MTQANSSKASRYALEPHEFPKDFVSNVVVYCVQPIEVDSRKSRHVYAKRYLHGDTWFKILLHINTDRHLGKYVATVSSAGRLRGLDDARDNGDADLMREQMHTRVLEAIVESGENRKGVVLGICPSLVRLERVNQCSCCNRDMLQHGIISNDCIGRFGLRALDRKGMTVSDLSSGRLHKCGDEMVQDGAQMVDSFVGQDLSDWRSLNYSKAIEVVRSIGIYLTAHGVWITRLETLDDSAQMAQVLSVLMWRRILNHVSPWR